ncbi:uncharacterized protein LOC144449539 isoform X2 [Glandiceps talaboti]
MAYSKNWLVGAVLLTTLALAVTNVPQSSNVKSDKLIWIKFLVTVNDTWDPKGCIDTVKTKELIPDKKYNQSDPIRVGQCDSGPLTYTNVNLIFYSSVIEDASPPTCQIAWNGTYLTPTKPGSYQSLLPGCFVEDSREGYHMTYYWFHILDWMWG